MNFSLYTRLSKSQNLAYFLQLNLISYTEPPLHHWWETLSPKLLGFFNLWLYYSFSSKILHRQGLWKNGVFRWGRGKQSTFQSFVHTDYHWSIHCPHLSGSLKIQRFSTVLHHDTDMDFFFSPDLIRTFNLMCPTDYFFPRSCDFPSSTVVYSFPLLLRHTVLSI